MFTMKYCLDMYSLYFLRAWLFCACLENTFISFQPNLLYISDIDLDWYSEIKIVCVIKFDLKLFVAVESTYCWDLKKNELKNR